MTPWERQRRCRCGTCRDGGEAAGDQIPVPGCQRYFPGKGYREFCSEYVCGRTPNPCIVCNPDVKFKTLLAAADEEGTDWIATGHYAGTYQDPESEEWFIRRARSEAKDQSYMLYRLGEDVISRLILPLNDAEDKEAVREIARKKALKNAEDKDSQEICFIEDGDDYKAFLRRNGCDLPKGDFVDADGNILGEHQGILHYTIGQRKGLGIALGKPAFVTGIDSEKNQVVLGDNQISLRQRLFLMGTFCWESTFRSWCSRNVKLARRTARVARPGLWKS